MWTQQQQLHLSQRPPTTSAETPQWPVQKEMLLTISYSSQSWQMQLALFLGRLPSLVHKLAYGDGAMSEALNS